MSENILTCVLCKKQQKSKGALENHQGSRQHRLNHENASNDSTVTAVDSMETLSEINSSNLQTMSMSNDTSHLIKQTVKKAVKREWKSNQLSLCVFCNNVSEDLESNLIHMLQAHRFSVPQANEVVRMADLVFQLHHKVNRVRLCLHCNKRFKHQSNVVRHMHDMNHMSLDITDDNPEFDLFQGQEDGQEQELEEVECVEDSEDAWEDVEELPELEGEEEELDEAETIQLGETSLPDVEVSLDKTKEPLTKQLQALNLKVKENKDNNPQSKSQGFQMEFWKRNRVLDNGQLLLEDGRTLGHKQQKLVQKQKPVFLNMLKFNTQQQMLSEGETGGSQSAFNDRIQRLKKSKSAMQEGTHRQVLDVLRENPYKFINADKHEIKSKMHIYRKNKDRIKSSLNLN